MKSEMIVITCRKCRAWYNMDMEEALDDDHFDMHTGEPCHADDTEWDMSFVSYRDNWRVAQ